jgi:hypothetical protein
MGWVTDVLQWLLDLVSSVIQTLWDMVSDVLWLVVDLLMGAAVTVIGLLDLSGLSEFVPSSYLAALPAEMLQVLGLIRVGEALGIVVTAIVIRIILQLIPFVRLGS